jgi:hypothetical protein
VFVSDLRHFLDLPADVAGPARRRRRVSPSDRLTRSPSASTAASLRAKARREGRPTDELLVLYVLERFLYRVSISAYRDRLVLKGGMLLAAFDERRPTADVDLLAQAIANDVDSISSVVREVLGIDVDDGVAFEPAGLRAQVVRDADPYTGVRITVPARIDRARHPLRIDINVGDPVTPEPVEVRYPSLRDEPLDWTRFLARSGLDDSAPASLAEAIRAIADFADPILAGGVTSGVWDPAARRWRGHDNG